MCGIFGFHCYGKALSDISILSKALASASMERGIDATGIAWNDKNKITINKAPVSADKFKICIPYGVKTIIGHTRHATQGSKKKNYNNHPFLGKVKDCSFALAHNGIIGNDSVLNKQYKFHSNIMTDSYIAVQLIQHYGKLNFESLKFVTKEIIGSYAFNILDTNSNTWLVKGDSPIALLHFPKSKIYVYASTKYLLWSSLLENSLFKDLQKGDFEEIQLAEGNILKICNNGKLVKENFEMQSCLDEYNWWDSNFSDKTDTNESYINDLKTIACMNGETPETVDSLLKQGFSCEDIEYWLYNEGMCY